jgi:hypothetical protein
MTSNARLLARRERIAVAIDDNDSQTCDPEWITAGSGLVIRLVAVARAADSPLARPMHAANCGSVEPSGNERMTQMASFQGMSEADKLNDLEIMNRALFFEHRGIWAYRVAADKLSTSKVGKAVLDLGSQNRADHEKHRSLLESAIRDLGGTPVQMQQEYDLSGLIRRGDGNVDSDVNIAKLALALEVGAAVGYVSDTTKLRSPFLIELEAGIACVEAIHAARIRAAFNDLGITIPVVPNVVMNTSSRTDWIIKV